MYFYLDIDAEYAREMVYMLVDDLYIKNNMRSMVEQRLEDLETKVTEQSLQYQVSHFLLIQDSVVVYFP